jgi:hypothetical protein
MMRNARLSSVFPVLFASLVAACSSTPSSGSRVTQSSRDNVTSVEIDGTSASSAMDLVSKLRPHWLRQGGTASIGGGSITSQVTLVYLDGNRLGGVDALRSISAGGVRSMQWIPATRAAIVLPDIGSEAIAGVISIRTTN